MSVVHLFLDPKIGYIDAYTPFHPLVTHHYPIISSHHKMDKWGPHLWSREKYDPLSSCVISKLHFFLSMLNRLVPSSPMNSLTIIVLCKFPLCPKKLKV